MSADWFFMSDVKKKCWWRRYPLHLSCQWKKQPPVCWQLKNRYVCGGLNMNYQIFFSITNFVRENFDNCWGIGHTTSQSSYNYVISCNRIIPENNFSHRIVATGWAFLSCWYSPTFLTTWNIWYLKVMLPSKQTPLSDCLQSLANKPRSTPVCAIQHNNCLSTHSIYIRWHQ